MRQHVLLSVVISAQGEPVIGAGAGDRSKSPAQPQHQQQPQLGYIQMGGAAIDPLARVVTPLSAYPGGSMQMVCVLTVSAGC